MKYLVSIIRYFHLILVFGIFQNTVSAQNFSSKNYLSDDIETLINSNPDQALKIAQYLLSKTNTSIAEKARINFLIANAYIVKGDYSSALNFLYEEKNYKEYLSDDEQIQISVAKIKILRELSLDKQSKIVLEKLENSQATLSEAKLKPYLEIAIAIENAEFLFKEKKIQEAINLLKKHESSVAKIADEYKDIVLNYYLILGQFYLEQEKLDESEKNFEAANDILAKLKEEDIYLNIHILHGLASIRFIKKEYNEAIILSKEAMGYIDRLGNVFLEVKINQLQSSVYLAMNDIANYKLVNAEFFDLQSETENQEQLAINTSYNLISDEYTDDYGDDKSRYSTIIYIVSGLFLIVLLISLFFWQKTVARKKGLVEIINYIEITRSNLMTSFSISDKKQDKQETKKAVILKETEEHILNKLKRFENSKRYTSKDISLAVLAGQLDSNTKYLSEIINTHYNVNFNTYINKLRINYIIEKLKTDPNFINYKISYLAENCGFSSHSSFATVFKSITGISPVKFIELLNQENENNLLE